jgi:FkbM family methyltransferase
MKTNIGLLCRLVRIYTFNSPIGKGKYRLANLAIRFSVPFPEEMIVRASDNRELFVKTTNHSYVYVYFTGDYEPAITRIFRTIIKPGDICLDVGANIGWYTTLFQKLVGNNGQVHAFEPVPRTYEFLKRNVVLNEPPRNVISNNLALGDEEKDVEIHVFPKLPEGHASISTHGHKDFESFSCRMVTLDSYLTANNIQNVNVIKMDIEGAELMMLKGASKLFVQEQLPVLEIEMAMATTRSFDYNPNDLIQYIKQRGDYNFFAIDESKIKLRQINDFGPLDIGANVLCLPFNFDLKQLSSMIIS